MAKATQIKGLKGMEGDRALQPALRRLIRRRLAEVEERVRGALSPPQDSDAAERIHDARVATRRLRAALALGRFTPRELHREASAQVRALGKALGAVRDQDELLAWLAGHDGDPALAPLRAPLQAEREADLAALRSAAQVFLGQAPELARRLAHLQASARRLGGRHVRARLRRRLRHFQAGLAPARGGHAEAVHELRIAAKKLRYQAEPLIQAVPATGAALKALALLQEALGGIHDLDVRERWLRQRMADAQDAERSSLAPALGQILAARAAQRQRLSAALQRWEQEAPLAALERALEK